jgi:HK97 family phage portal protein
MSVLTRLAGALGYERRAESLSSVWPGMGQMSAAGYIVNSQLTENLSAAVACVNVMASAIASLPPYVFRHTPAGRMNDAAHPVARLLRRPNERQTWSDFIEMTMAEVLLRGNALAIIESDGAGRPVALHPVPWSFVQPQLLPSGRLAFDVVQMSNQWGGTGRPRRVFADECFHLKDRSDDGYIGRSRISRAPDVIGNAAGLQEWSGSMWRNQATPSGAIMLEAALQQPQLDRLRAQFDQGFTGAGNARRVMILDNKAKWQALSVSPEDAEVLASRKFSVEELCRLFGVPPPLVQDYSRNTFTNAATAGLWFAQFTLAPWCKKIEAEFQRSVFGSSSADRCLEIDLSALTRGDFAARWASYDLAVRNGILTPDEIREAEGYNPRGEAAVPPPASPAQGA